MNPFSYDAINMLENEDHQRCEISTVYLNSKSTNLKNFEGFADISGLRTWKRDARREGPDSMARSAAERTVQCLGRVSFEG